LGGSRDQGTERHGYSFHQRLAGRQKGHGRRRTNRANEERRGPLLCFFRFRAGEVSICFERLILLLRLFGKP
jgi:hypothetical protein